MKTYLDFEIHIGTMDANTHVVAVSGPGGEARGTFALPIDDPGYLALAERLKHLDTDETILVGIGQWLFEAVFHGPVRDVYTRSQGILVSEQGLRLRFHVDPTAARIAALPWE